MYKNKILGYVVSDVGLVRVNNEDNFLLGHCLNEHRVNHMDSFFCQDIGKWTCAAVFDGMGGVEGGEIASHIAAHVFQENSLEISTLNPDEITEVFEKSFVEANYSVINERKHKSTCGTTCSAIATNGLQFRIFHRGDSRVYLLREGRLFILSKDHTLAQLKLDVGIYHSKEEVLERENHQLTEYIGMDELGGTSKPFESEWFELKENDRILMCSDGLYDMCTKQDILDILQNTENIENAANKLLQLALKNGGKDNVTILILE